MKKHLEKLQREIQETRSSKSDKERQLNQERARIQVKKQNALFRREIFNLKKQPSVDLLGSFNLNPGEAKSLKLVVRRIFVLVLENRLLKGLLINERVKVEKKRKSCDRSDSRAIRLFSKKGINQVDIRNSSF